MPSPRIVMIQPDAPPKPALGAPCNGCGLCCLAEPCPAGMLVSQRQHGTCTALRWDGMQARYVCGLMSEPLTVLGLQGADAQPGRLRQLLARGIRAWARRLIASGVGCDADLQRERPPEG